MGGGGIVSGDFCSLNGIYFKVSSGPALKLFLFPSENRTAFIFGGSLNHLFEKACGRIDGTGYYKLYAGIEF
jgi:hypothetical protein